MAKPPYISSQSQPEAQNYNHQVPQEALHSVFFNNQQGATVDYSKNLLVFHQNINLTIKTFYHIFSQDKDYFSRINNNLLRINKSITGKIIRQLPFISQIFSNYCQKKNKHENQEELFLQEKNSASSNNHTF